MWENFYSALYADDGLLFFDEYSGIVTFCSDEMGIPIINHNNINLDNNFDEDDPDSIILIRLLACHSKFKKHKTLKKKDKWRINANRIGILKDDGIFSCQKVKKKQRNRTGFYWVMLLKYTIWEYQDILTQEIMHEDLI